MKLWWRRITNTGPCDWPLNHCPNRPRRTSRKTKFTGPSNEAVSTSKRRPGTTAIPCVGLSRRNVATTEKLFRIQPMLLTGGDRTSIAGTVDCEFRAKLKSGRGVISASATSSRLVITIRQGRNPGNHIKKPQSNVGYNIHYLDHSSTLPKTAAGQVRAHPQSRRQRRDRIEKSNRRLIETPIGFAGPNRD
jgi:hypothetical protein